MVNTMPATITVKNIPDAVHMALKKAAETSHRSLNGEVIARLEQSLQGHADPAHLHIDRAQALHQSLGQISPAKLAKIDIVKTIRTDRDRR